tara:strand:- start:342 stop:446 length:105 start_codon:yes stop_codon:yes gene_type:complete
VEAWKSHATLARQGGKKIQSNYPKFTRILKKLAV